MMVAALYAARAKVRAWMDQTWNDGIMAVCRC